MTGSLRKRVLATGTALALICVFGAAIASAAAPMKTGLKVFVIPKNLGNSYFTTSDSAKSGGAIAALNALKESGTETSGTAATPASQIPAIQAAITKGANVLLVSATDASALCPTLNSAMQKGITVVTYDSDAPACRNLFINQATPQGIGASEVDLLAKQIGGSGQIAIVSAAASATNQNAWIGFMKKELKKYPKMQLVSTVYGNDDPTTSTQVTEGLLQQYPNLKGIISPTTVGIAAAAAVLDTAKYRGKVQLDRPRHAELVAASTSTTARSRASSSGTRPTSATWPPTPASHTPRRRSRTPRASRSPPASSASSRVGAGHSILLGAPYVFNKANISKFNF